MANVPWDDASKLFAKYLSKEIQKVGKSKAKKVKSSLKDAPKKGFVRADKLKSTKPLRDIGGQGIGSSPSYSIRTNKKPIEKFVTKTQSPSKIKSVGEGADAARNMKTKKVMNKPVKPKQTYLKTKDRIITTSPTEQRAAEREATRRIRRSGDRPAYNPQPTSGQRPVGRPAPSSTTASKRTRGMSKDKGNNSRGRFEADKTKSEIADDKKQFGKGQPMPKKKNVPPRKGAKPIIVGGKFKPVRGDKLKSTSSVRNSVDDWIDYPSSKIKSKPTKKSPAKKAPARKKPEPTSRYRTDTGTNLKSLRDNINKAETPAQKRAAKKARIEWLKKNGMKP